MTSIDACRSGQGLGANHARAALPARRDHRLGGLGRITPAAGGGDERVADLDDPVIAGRALEAALADQPRALAVAGDEVVQPPAVGAGLGKRLLHAPDEHVGVEGGRPVGRQLRPERGGEGLGGFEIGGEQLLGRGDEQEALGVDRDGGHSASSGINAPPAAAHRYREASVRFGLQRRAISTASSGVGGSSSS